MSVPGGLLDALRAAQHVCVLTGSGISAESGVPTFREAQTGLWEQYDPHELATPEAFQRDPELVWRWYRWRRDLVAGVGPNAGHHALVTLAGLVPELTIVTQNVDGLHQRAGSDGVIEFHGNLFEDRCFVEGCIVSDALAKRSPNPHCKLRQWP
jgi:NAD-dependent deacetylase